MPDDTDGKGWVSHLAHNGALMACDLMATKGNVRILLAKSLALPNNHAPLIRAQRSEPDTDHQCISTNGDP
eukprot:scaffold74545_cov37-Tisochrysis_lutea.AAC.3